MSSLSCPSFMNLINDVISMVEINRAMGRTMRQD